VRLNLRNLFWLLRRSIYAAFDDGCLGIAKGAAYSALLSFFPVLASAATILVQTRAEFVSHFLEDTLDQIVPPGSETLVMQQFRVTGARPVSLLIAAFAISVWAASGVVACRAAAAFCKPKACLSHWCCWRHSRWCAPLRWWSSALRWRALCWDG